MTQDENEKIKRLRYKARKMFLLLFVPHLMVYILTSKITTNPIDIDNLKWQLCWFLIYFTIAFFIYIFAPKIINKQI